MEIKTLIQQFAENREVYNQITQFSNQPGIYAVFCTTSKIPNIDKIIASDEIIYIGMTTKSQQERDASTHFKAGRTGGSTLRRSLGALLRETLSLNAIPRGSSETGKKFKFDEDGENRLSEWMSENLALSYFDYPESKEDILELEKRLIEKLVPILNLDKNPRNPFGEMISKRRSECGEIAQKLITSPEIEVKTPISKRVSLSSSKAKGKYIDLWTNYLPSILRVLESPSSEGIVSLTEREFQMVGKRAKYSFRLNMEKGKVANNIGGSAVARDLLGVLCSSNEIMEILRTGLYSFRLDKDFCLNIDNK